MHRGMTTTTTGRVANRTSGYSVYASSTKVPDSSPELASHNTMYTNNNYLMIILSHSGCKIFVTCDTAQLS